MNSNDKVIDQSDANQTAETGEVSQSSTDTQEAARNMPDATAPEVAPVADLDQDSDHDLFMAALNNETAMPGDEFMLNAPQRGAIIQGTIASISDSEIMVDIGAKSEGVISGKELEELDNESRKSLHVGEDVFVFVLSPEDRNGHAALSLRRAMEEQDWRDAERYQQDGGESEHEAARSRHVQGARESAGACD